MRQPMQVTIALSAEQLKHAGVPKWMTEDELADCLDQALLADDSMLAEAILEFIDERLYAYDSPSIQDERSVEAELLDREVGL